MDVEQLFASMPFADLLGIELTAAGDGRAEGRLPMREDLSWNPEEATAHGGAVFALADTVGGAALASLVGRPTPTVDMRIDYLAPGRSDLVARAEVVREGGSVGTVDVTVEDAEGTRVAEARGVYKTG